MSREKLPAGEQRSASLLLPKLHMPRLHTSLIERSHLLEQLEVGAKSRLAILVAPAGFGKTTLVRQWIAQYLAEKPVAWLSLDTEDNDPERFWRYMLVACQQLGANVEGISPHLYSNGLIPPFELPSLEETVLTPLLNALTHLERPATLILDDYHLIDEPRIHASLSFLLRHLPLTLRVILLTRAQPTLSLARLRGNGELYELHAPELRFSSEETEQFLCLGGATLSPEQLRLVMERLEGWPAGLRLLSLALAHHHSTQEIAYYLTTLAGDERAWLDYFVSEVLDAQPEPVQRFLLQTGIPGRLTGSLCSALTGLEDCEQMLENLAQAHLFLDRLDGPGSWYRYHQFFAEAMQHEARQRLGADRQQARYHQASQWYEQHGLQMEAIEMAFKANELERAVALMAVYSETPLLNQYTELHTLRRWLEQIPREMLERYPRLYLTYAGALTFDLGPDNMTPQTLLLVEELLQHAERDLQDREDFPNLGTALALHSMVVYRLDQWERAAEYGQQALKWLPPDAHTSRAICLTTIGMYALDTGQIALARQAYQQSYHCWEAAENPHGMRGNGILVDLASLEIGALRIASEHLRLMLIQARRYHDPVDTAQALLCQARIFYEWNELEDAREALQEISDLREHLHFQDINVRADLLLIRVQQAQGGSQGARQALSSLFASLSPQRNQRVYREVLIAQIRLLIALGDLAGASQALQLLSNKTLVLLPPSAHTGTGLLVPARDQKARLYQTQETLLTARLLLAQRQIPQAREHLTQIFALTQSPESISIALEIQVLMLLVHMEENKLEEAAQSLHALLTQTASEGYLRLFLDEGEAMTRALQTLLPALQDKALRAHLQNILLAFTASQAEQSLPTPISGMLEPLSAQEQRVLRLLASGRTNAEIAQEFVVSINTVRTQVQSIYRKLDVNNRVEASEVARKLKLL